MTIIRVNGAASNSISALDRGLFYGDGVFRTLRLKHGRPLNWQCQYQKLRQDCTRLNLDCPSDIFLSHEIQTLSSLQPDGVVKIIVTRGGGARGYAIQNAQQATNIVQISPAPQFDPSYAYNGITLHTCQLKLGHQVLLAGVKHLNRLENVLAASEYESAHAAEGLLEDEAGWVISGTRSNLFAYRQGTLYTPDLSQCGVAGVQRDRVMTWAKDRGVECKVIQMRREALCNMDEIFLVNSVFGLWPVHKMGDYLRTQHPVAWQIQQWLNDENNQ
ncbi:MAG: aminodeoxychorismate lyase [Sideroxydans sp.]|nr:aminodeoxychorismate lyase [Sideroxydans sp.]